MQTYKEWQSATAALYEKSNLSGQQGLFSGVDVSPLSTEKKSPQKPPLKNSSNFLNILPFHVETVTPEFLQQKNSAVLIEGAWPEELDGTSATIFCKASPHVNSFKKALLKSDKYQSVDLGIDPYSLGLWKSVVFRSEKTPEQIRVALDKNSKSFRFGGQSYSLSGASEVQQLAILLASVMQLVDDYEGPMSLDEILKSYSLELSLTPNIFSSVAKINAMQLLTARLYEIIKWQGDLPPLYTTASLRFMSAREPWNNILRMTSVATSAAMAGAQGFFAMPYDLLSTKAKGYRTSRNIVEILQRESHLGRVQNPAWGSYSLRDLVEQYCEKAWTLFVEIQKKGGLFSTLQSGWLLSLIHEEGLQQETLFQKGQLGLVGSNRYPLMDSLSEKYTLPAQNKTFDIETFWEKSYSEEKAETRCEVARWIPKTLPSLFEKWQFRGDHLTANKGSRPQIMTLVEPGLEASKKFKLAQQTMALAGLKLRLAKPDEKKTDSIVAVVASDPDGEFAKTWRDRLEQVDCPLKLWVGEKAVEGFDDFIGKSSDKDDLFQKVFAQIEGGL